MRRERCQIGSASLYGTEFKTSDHEERLVRNRLIHRRLGWLYGTLVILLVVMGAWWIYYVTHEEQVRADFHRRQLASERLHAEYLIRFDPSLAADPVGQLGDAFPNLVFRRDGKEVVVEVRPELLVEIENEVRATRNMFLYEGLFFLVLLLAGASILSHAWRSELKFKQARELFLAGATHEFKTPLASLRLYTETLGRDGVAEEDHRRIRSRMLDDILRLESLVDDVLALSADDTFSRGPRQRLDLAGECRTVVNELQGFAADHGARIGLSAPDGCQIMGQRLVFALALRNLVSNAVKHGGSGVKIDVQLTPGDTWHQVSVKDDGPGIPRRLHGKVFSCFFSGCGNNRGEQTGLPTRGAGLGLYLVKRNIDILGGRVTLNSDTGRGATFTMFLPALAPTMASDRIPSRGGG